ncbi:hypothetical protein GCM10028808_20630 [Spirosoma migulaei]
MRGQFVGIRGFNAKPGAGKITEYTEYTNYDCDNKKRHHARSVLVEREKSLIHEG